MYGVETGIDVNALMDAAEDVATPIMGKNLPRIGRESLTLGYAVSIPPSYYMPNVPKKDMAFQPAKSF